VTTDRRQSLVCIARLDNRPELYDGLDIPLAQASCQPDSVLMQKAYLRWGADFADHLIGDYSCALWDADKQKLYLVRSPVGGRPLFYHVTDNHFAFASSPRALFALSHVRRELDFQRIADYLAMAPAEPGSSFFRGIRRLLPGHMLTVSRGAVDIRRFWQPELRSEIRYASDDEYVDEFNALFERVVSDQMRSGSPVGVMMSGGLDSASVAALAAIRCRAEGKRLATFTEVPRHGFDGKIVPGRYADETALVRLMADRYDNLDLNFIRTDNRLYLDDLDRYFAAAHMPFRSATNRTWYEEILQQAAAQGVRVLLTGACGNLTISRDGSGLLPNLVRAGRWWQAYREAKALCGHSAMRTLTARGIKPLLSSSLVSVVQRMRNFRTEASGSDSWQSYSAINPAFARAQRVGERAGDKGFDFLFRMDPNVREAYGKLLPIVTMNGNDSNHAYRQIFGVDVRDPTADSRIVEFCLRLPEEQYLKGGVSRRLIRRAMEHRLPREILENRQRGLQTADWYERLFASRERVLAELVEWRKNGLLCEVLDLNRMARLLEQMSQIPGDARKFQCVYRDLMECALMVGRFILWFEKGAAGIV
jgi:asparagine synthase (glutamine-hydrolysing)